MHALLAPVLAQLVTLGLADRLEGRYVIGYGQKQFDGINTTTPAGTVRFDLGRASIRLGYAPTLTIVPLFETPRELLLYHRGYLGAEYRWKRTTVSLGQAAGYGDRDFQLEALMPRQTTAGTTPYPQGQQTAANPAGQTPNGTPAAGGTGGTGAAPGGTTPGGVRPYQQDTGKINFADFRSFLALTHAVSRPLSLRLLAGYTISGGTTAADRQLYPLTHGPDATLAARYTADARNALVTTLTGVYTKTENGNRGAYTTLTEDYLHGFTRQTLGIVGAGVSFGRTEPPGGLPLYSIYPMLRVGVVHASRLAQGIFTVTLDVNTAPAMDLNTATVDPRIGTTASASWTRERFSLVATAASTISIQREQSHTFDSILTSATARYDIGAGFATDLGTRTTFQRYNGQDTIPQTWVMFFAVSYTFLQPLNAPRAQKAAATGGGGAAPAAAGNKEKGAGAGAATATGKGGGAAGGGKP
jgi:hypothetical protein